MKTIEKEGSVCREKG